MTWVVSLRKSVIKELKRLPNYVLRDFEALVDDIEVMGPVRGDWPNYSKLSDDRHHCHLNYSYVVVWSVADKQVKLVEVTYVGSRKDAPY
jgi:mRNA-degrading endonuclease RelE of RelBE toxin-antitoxin system